MNLINLLRTIEPQYFLDYVLFSGMLRNYVVRSLEEEHRRYPSDIHRRFFTLSIVQEEYMAYEDLSAFLLAFLQWRSGEVSFPLDVLLSYRPGDAVLDEILKKRSVTTGEELYKVLELSKWLPPGWKKRFPDIDLEKALILACSFFVVDCRRNQKKYGRNAFNKIKHSAVVIPDASRYDPYQPPLPGTIFLTPNGDLTSQPLTLYAFQMSDSEIEGRLRVIEFIQNNLRLLAGLYVLCEHEPFMKVKYSDAFDIWQEPSLASLIQFLRQVTRP